MDSQALPNIAGLLFAALAGFIFALFAFAKVYFGIHHILVTFLGAAGLVSLTSACIFVAYGNSNTTDRLFVGFVALGVGCAIAGFTFQALAQ
ncbi:MAG: hypothetical protein WAX89_01330 [Alphaproteobacteria bacterium]